MTLLRLLCIFWVLSRYRLDRLFKRTKVVWLFYPFLLINIPAWFRTTQHERGQRLRQCLEDLGPIFVKFGQVLSTRPDLIPHDIAQELAKLQDQVPPFPGQQAIQLIETAYQNSISDIFQSFDAQPLASASVAQVHAATLTTGEDVIVKIIRPQIARVIRHDIRLLYILARLLTWLWKDAKRLHPSEVVREFDKTIFAELDMRREAANATQLRHNFIHSNIMYVPKIYWQYTKASILTMERIYGIRISDIDTLQANSVDMKLLAERGVEIFYSQVFRDRLFHADMHPGNIFVDITDPDNPKYCGVDFGIVGSLTEEDHYYLAQNFLAFFNRDYHRVAQLHIDSGWVSLDTRADELEAAIRVVCEPIFNKPLSEISFGQVLLQLFNVARQFNMEVQPQLVLLQKTLLNVEGLGRQLYPQLDLWQTAKPHLEHIMRRQTSLRSVFKKVRYNLPIWLQQAPGPPAIIAPNLN